MNAASNSGAGLDAIAQAARGALAGFQGLDTLPVGASVETFDACCRAEGALRRVLELVSLDIERHKQPSLFGLGLYREVTRT